MAGQLGSVKKNGLVESRAEIHLFSLGYGAEGWFWPSSVVTPESRELPWKVSISLAETRVQ